MHPIHKHGSGMRSAERYDAKEAYNKKLSSKARMHYLENDIADHKGSPAHMEGGRKNHKMSNSEYAAHLESPRGKKEHGAGMSRYGSSDSPAELTAEGKKKIMASDANQSFKDAIAKAPLSRESAKQEKKDLMKYNAVDDKAGMSRYKCKK